MAVGDFAKFIQPNIRNHLCDSCGANEWELIEHVEGELPVAVTRSPGGNVRIPPLSINAVWVVCRKCHFLRTYLLPAAATPKAP